MAPYPYQMKLLPNISLPQLPPVSAAGASLGGMTGLDSRMAPGIPLPFSPTDFLWRYTPAAMTFSPSAQPPANPFFDFKTHLPNNLASDPRIWSRDDVANFLRWCEREFDLPTFDMDMFQMNGKALCLLTKSDLGERSPGAGDVLHNILNMLARDFSQRCLPGSPVTPTRPQASYPLSPHSHPPTPTWVEHPYTANLASLMSANSVTLSPAPSLDSQAGSPGHTTGGGGGGGQEGGSSSSSSQQSSTNNNNNNSGHHIGIGAGPTSTNSGAASTNTSTNTMSNGGNSHHHALSNGLGNGTANMVTSQIYKSDSDEDNQHGGASSSNSASPPATPTALTAQRLSEVCMKDERSPTLPPHHLLPLTPGAYRAAGTPGVGADSPYKRDAFFPSDSPEPTNGRLLWDFLQQLLNDPTQRYTNYIAWKNQETGVFKIIDPAGLARLWGIQKNHLSMNYDKMSRALRYYYRVNILRKVQGERHCYQFLRKQSELKNIKNISLLRNQTRIKPEPGDEEPMTPTTMEPDTDMPTDLSMTGANSQMSTSNHDAHKTSPNSDMHEHKSAFEHAKHTFERISAFEPKSPFEHKTLFEPKSPYEHPHSHMHNNFHHQQQQYEPAQLQPLSLSDPPMKYRSHSFNLVKTDSQQTQQRQATPPSTSQSQTSMLPPQQQQQQQQQSTSQPMVEERK
uniref:Ets DNA-binding protein pokkuri n=1 Tax=Trichogramma kaykai TaxID=54128 RepID=A0ABD2XM70_9HYME